MKLCIKYDIINYYTVLQQLYNPIFSYLDLRHVFWGLLFVFLGNHIQVSQLLG